jgi:Prokaryotic N-terminal methylation motif
MLHFFAKRLKELHEVERDERGFTLIELLVVTKRSVRERSTIPREVRYVRSLRLQTA